jgi:uncharacterized repeat protein (TIGR03803 family)
MEARNVCGDNFVTLNPELKDGVGALKDRRTLYGSGRARNLHVVDHFAACVAKGYVVAVPLHAAPKLNAPVYRDPCKGFSSPKKLGECEGAATIGAIDNDGTVFKIATSGAYNQLYSFAGGSDGELPLDGLTNVGGTLFGTTALGGASDDGVIYAMLSNSGPEIVVYSFAAGSDGRIPNSVLTSVSGKLFGTTRAGGAIGYGTVFTLSF